MARKQTPAKRDEIATEESSDSVARRTFVALSVALAFVASLWFLYTVRNIVVWLLVAFVFALALAPLVGWLQQRRLKRGPASFLAVLALILVSVGILSAVATPLVSQSDNFVDNLPKIVDEISRVEFIRDLNDRFGLADRVRESQDTLPQIVTGPNASLVNTVRGTFEAFFSVVVILTLTFFMLLEGPSAWRHFIRLFKQRDARRLERIGDRVHEAISGYVWGNLLVVLMAGTFAFITLTIFGVPYALPIAIAAGVASLIPFVGATLATILLTLIALTQGLPTGVAVFFTYTAYQIVESNFIVPFIFSKTLKMSPLLVLIATITGGSLAGVVGVLLAIPAASMIQTVVVELLQGSKPVPKPSR